jgi:hypothetical protein
LVTGTKVLPKLFQRRPAKEPVAQDYPRIRVGPGLAKRG